MVENRQPVAHRQRLLLVVGDEDEGDTDLPLQRLQLGLHRLAELQVESAQGFVEEQDRGSVDQRPGQSHPLSLPARQLRRLAVPEALKPDQSQGLLDPAAAFGLGHSCAPSTNRRRCRPTVICGNRA